jgi:hypothetical protein
MHLADRRTERRNRRNTRETGTPLTHERRSRGASTKSQPSETNMFFLTEAARARFERNRRKANGIVGTLGERARDYAHKQIETCRTSTRDRAHWQRVARHVDAILAGDR